MAGTLLFGGGAALLIWRLQPERRVFFSDADTIRAPQHAVAPRDILWRPAQRLPALASAAGEDYEPRVSWDGLTLFFVRGKAGGDADVLVATRTPTGWAEPQPLERINGDYDDLGPEPSPDGRALYFYSDRPGGLGGYDLWVARRGDDGWETPTNLGPRVNSEFNDYGPAISPDGATLLFASNRPTGDAAVRPNPEAWVATVREDLLHRTYDLYASSLTDSGPTDAARLSALNTAANEGAACFSPAGDFLYFCSDRSGGSGGFDLYRSRHVRDDWQPPANLGTEVNSASNELDPALAHLGFALLFSSDRPADGSRPGAYNVYQTTAREVFAETELAQRNIDWAALQANLFWLLLALLLVTLLLLFLRSQRDRRLSLLARCLLFSLLLHSLLMLAMSFWNVTADIVKAVGGGGKTKITLASAGAGDTLYAQVRGDFTQASTLAAVEARLEPLPPPAPTAEKPLLAAIAPPVIQPADRSLTASDVAATAAPTPTAPEMQIDALQTPADAQPVAAGEAIPAAPPPMALRAEKPNVEWPASQPAVKLADIQPRSTTAARSTESLAARDEAPAVGVAPAGATPVPDAPAVALDLPKDVAPAASAPESAASLPGPVAPLGSQTNPIPVATGAVGQNALSAIVVAPPSLGTNGHAAPSLATGPMQPGSAAASVNATNIPAVELAAGFALPADRAAFGSGVAVTEKSSGGISPVAAAPGPSRASGPLLPVSGGAPRRIDLTPTVGSSKSGEKSLVDVVAPSGSRNMSPTTDPSGTTPVIQPPAIGLRLPVETTPEGQPYAQRDPEQRSPMLAQRGGNERTEKAVAAALNWLAQHEHRDGHWDGAGFDDACSCGGDTEYEVDVALTGLSLLCFLGAGHTHVKDGPYRENVQRGLRWLLKRQDERGDLRGDETMYTQGIATIALSEAFGMSGDSQLSDPLKKAVSFIAAARNDRTGGWRYEPGQAGDTSVLGWQVMALKSAKLCSVDVPAEAFDSARRWLENVVTPGRPGLYAYRPNRRATASMTAEAMFVNELLGVAHDDPKMEGAAAAIVRELPNWRGETNTYYWYYATLALFHRQGETWERWNERLTGELLAHQEADGHAAGSWPPRGEWAPVGGRIYQTALCTLMLEVYYRYLPLYSLDVGRTSAAAPPSAAPAPTAAAPPTPAPARR